MISLFCSHKFIPKEVIRGENLLGSVQYAISFYCIRCNRRRLDKGWRSEISARRHLDWLRSQQ